MTSCYLCEAVKGLPAKTTQKYRAVPYGSIFASYRPRSIRTVILIPSVVSCLSFSRPSLSGQVFALPAKLLSVCLGKKQNKKNTNLVSFWVQFCPKLESVWLSFFYSHDAIWATHTSTPQDHN